jgi:endoglucanase
MFQPVDRFIHNKRLGRGVNIVGYDPIWESRANARIQAKHFKRIREAGFNHVRINMHPFQFMRDSPDYEIQSAWLETLDWVIGECKKNGLLIILDMHEFNAMAVDPVGLKQKFLAVWKQLAVRYQDADENMIFEVLNEPHNKITPELWNEYLKEPLAIIRETNPTRTLIIGPATWNSMDNLYDLKLPKDDPHIIVTVHYYNPMAFTHQGAPWSKYGGTSGVSWLGTKDEIQRLQQDFNYVNAWAKDNDYPIYLGEFGAYDAGDMQSRIRYIGAVSSEAERLGWSWGYWQFDSDFIVYDINKDCWVESIRDALIPTTHVE